MRNLNSVTIALVLASLLGGCAATNAFMTNLVSVDVPAELIASRTEMAIGADAEDFVISDVATEGLRTNWKVTLNSGETMRCYLEAAQDFGAKSISDAICSGPGARSGSPASCDALSKAAGRC